MAKMSGNSRGVEAPQTKDMALQGDTRHKLHTSSLSKGIHLGGGVKHPVGGGPDPNMCRYDDGMGTDEAEDNC